MKQFIFLLLCIFFVLCTVTGGYCCVIVDATTEACSSCVHCGVDFISSVQLCTSTSVNSYSNILPLQFPDTYDYIDVDTNLSDYSDGAAILTIPDKYSLTSGGFLVEYHMLC